MQMHICFTSFSYLKTGPVGPGLSHQEVKDAQVKHAEALKGLI